MPKREYEITGPDGVPFVIEGPDDATKEQIATAAKRAYALKHHTYTERARQFFEEFLPEVERA